MTHQFDARGEAAIANLRRDKRFNEALYRELGPVKYWIQVSEAEIAIKNHDIPVADSMLVIPESQHFPLEFENAMEKNHAKAVNIATMIVMVGAAFSITTVMIAVAAIIVYGAWTWIF